jgi:hypothetical protein
MKFFNNKSKHFVQTVNILFILYKWHGTSGAWHVCLSECEAETNKLF